MHHLAEIVLTNPWGSILGAIIAGLFSFLALVISKENKTSEFRQAWIDALRSEVADFIAAVRQFQSALYSEILYPTKVHAEIHSESIKRIHEFADRLQLSSNLIRLRLHTKGDENYLSKELIDHMNTVTEKMTESNDLRATIPSGKPMDPATIAAYKVLNKVTLDALLPFRETAQKLLKHEWERVKKGEPWFRWSRCAFALFSIASGLIFLATLFVYAANFLIESAK